MSRLSDSRKGRYNVTCMLMNIIFIVFVKEMKFSKFDTKCKYECKIILDVFNNPKDIFLIRVRRLLTTCVQK
jgi:hypothetical protein